MSGSECYKCGQGGHYARDCSAASGVKRPRDDASDFAPTGGGYLPSPAGESPTQQKFSARSSDQQSITPTTLRMLWTAEHGTDEVFRIDGHPLVQVTFIGKVVSVDDTNNTNLAYKIDDGTGSMDVKFWLETDDTGAARNKEVLPTGSYVRVYGHLRNWQNSLNVVAFRILPIPDSNEITYHFLEVIRVHLYNTKGPVPTGSTPGITGVIGGGNVPPAPAPGPSPSGVQFNDIQTAILQIVANAPNKDLGASRNEVVNACNQRWAPTSITEHMEFLLSEGHMYTTMDEEHFTTSVVV